MDTKIFDALLARGLLPIQLPPGFSSASFASELPKFKTAWNKSGNSAPVSQAGRFSVPRSSYYRRNTALLNPVGFYFLAKDIAKHWAALDAHYQQSALSRSVPKFTGASLRAIELRKFGELYEEKVIAGAGYRYALITDITSFFPTIYTHSIPWALHGKAVAKADSSPALFGNVLDKSARQTQDRQTIGLPIGPDTSHILAELIGVAIDLALHEQLGFWPAGFRYVDDFFLFANTRAEAERYLAAVSRAAATMELQIAPSKTKIIEARELVDESWKYRVKKLRIASSRKQQREDLHYYFGALFSLEKQCRDESVVKYGLKQASSSIIKKSNWPVFETYLLKCGFTFPNTLQVICQILTTYFSHHYPLSLEAISRFCNSQLRVLAANDCHGEVAWLLWICKELILPVEQAAVDEVLKMQNPVATLILLDLAHHPAFRLNIDLTALTQFATGKTLSGPHWLLAYEAGRREWLGVGNTNFIDQHVHFGPLKAAGVEFYESGKLGAPIFELKDPTGAGDIDFDDDRPISDRFKFDDLDEEYFDSARRSEGDESDDGEEPGGDF